MIRCTYRCESWTIRKAECQRIYVFELWCWRRLLRVPWTARRPNQFILKEINLEYSLEGLMLKLKLQYFDHLMLTRPLEKTIMLGKKAVEQVTDCITVSTDMNLRKLQETVKDREAWRAIVHRVT